MCTYIHVRRRWSMIVLMHPWLFHPFFRLVVVPTRKKENERRGRRTEWKKEHREKEGEGKERKAESWLDAKPVERHALGKEKQTKRGWARRLENHRCDSSQVPIGRPSDRPLYRYIYILARPGLVVACCILCAEYFRSRRVQRLSLACRCSRILVFPPIKHQPVFRVFSAASLARPAN